MTQQEAIDLEAIFSMPGWRYILRLKDEQIQDYQEKLITMMDLKPQEFTGKKAIQLCAKQKALKRFFEDLNDDVRIHKSNSNERQSERTA